MDPCTISFRRDAARLVLLVEYGVVRLTRLGIGRVTLLVQPLTLLKLWGYSFETNFLKLGGKFENESIYSVLCPYQTLQT